jgi:ABC-type antimicrobial peptide transport system permease subunit
VLGVPCSLLFAKLMTGVLAPGALEAFDPRAYIAGTVSLAVVALTAAWIPARRATRIDPVAALRQD